MERIPDTLVQEILDRTSILDIVGERVTLKAKGANWWGLCPFHSEKTPSFSVAPEKGIFHCFGCQAGGDAARFLMTLDKISFPEALEILAKKAGVAWERGANPSGEFSEEQKLKNSLLELNARLESTFQHLLETHPQAETARQTLEKRRVLREFQQRFGLGYIPEPRDWLYGFLTKKHYSPEFLRATGLFSQKHERSCLFAGRLVFPIRNAKKQTIAWGGRLLAGEGPKYINSPETPIFKKRQSLFGLDQAIPAFKQSDEVLVCEGYMDVIALHMAGVSHAVAPLGTAFTEEQGRLLQRWTRRAHFVFDGDAAGQKAALKSLMLAEDLDWEARVSVLDSDADPASLWESKAEDTLQKALKYTINAFDYILDTYVRMSSAEGRLDLRAFQNASFEFGRHIRSEVRREQFLEGVAQRLRVGREHVRADFGRFLKQGPSLKVPEPVNVPAGVPYKGPDLSLVLAILVHRDLYPGFRRHVAPADLEDSLARKLFVRLEETQASVSTEEIFSSIRDEPGLGLARGRLLSGEFDSPQEQLVQDGIRVLKRRSLEVKRRELTAQIQDCQRSGQDVAPLIEEKMFLDREIERYKAGTYV